MSCQFLPGGSRWANASAKSHAELDEATELDTGDPAALANAYLELRGKLKNLNVFGGCCGTDQRHIVAIARAIDELKIRNLFCRDHIS